MSAKFEEREPISFSAMWEACFNDMQWIRLKNMDKFVNAPNHGRLLSLLAYWPRRSRSNDRVFPLSSMLVPLTRGGRERERRKKKTFYEGTKFDKVRCHNLYNPFFIGNAAY